MISRTQLEILINDEAVALTDYTVDTRANIIFPCEEYETGVNKFTTAYIMDFAHTSDSKRHTVGILYNGTEFALTCGDGHLEGKNSKVSATRRVDDIMTKLTNFEPSHFPKIKKGLMDCYKSYEKNAPCGFWRQWKSKGNVCKHLKHMFYEIQGTNILNDLVTTYEAYENASATATTSTTKPKSDHKFLERYSFKKHVKIEGPKGSGKTFGVHAYLDDIGIPDESRFFVGGNNSIEAYQLLGSLTPYVREIIEEVKSVGLKANKSFATSSTSQTKHVQDLIWKNGPLTAAFKKAAKGEKAVLIIDEILRIPSRERNILTASLTPDNKGYYTLRTEKMTGLDENGDGIEEVVRCKKEFLWAISTTNVGADYDIDDSDEAEEDRWVTLHLETDRTKLKSILEENTKAKKFKPTIVSSLMEFYDKMTKYKSMEQLSRIINIRHLCEAVEIATKQSEIKEILEDYILVWVDRDHDGKPEAAQVKLVSDTIAKAFK